MLSNPFWHALQTEHAPFSIGSGSARRYPADVIPFSAFEHGNTKDLAALCDLLEPGETTFVIGYGLSRNEHLTEVAQLPCLQMHFRAEAVPTLTPADIEHDGVQLLGASDAPAMVALTEIAFPGFFRVRTYQLGRYFGIRVGGELVGMAGERIALPGFREISAVCTHPSYTGRGYAARLISHLLRLHATEALRSFLHVAAANERAIALYERIGFVKSTQVLVHQLLRS